MPAYAVFDIEVTDPDAFERYRAEVPAVLARHGGRYLVRGGELHAVEGEFGLTRMVIVEFPSLEAARRFYSSPEYAPLLQLRVASTRSRAVLVEGYVPPA